MIPPRVRLLALALALAGCSDNTGPGAAAKLVFTVQPTSITALNTFSVSVSVEDAAGRVVTSATNQITLALGTNPVGAVLGGATPTTIAPVNGVAVYNGMQIVKAAQGYTLSATSTGLAPGNSVSFNVSPGPPYALRFAVQPVSTPLGSILPPFQVSIDDSLGNRVGTDTAVVSLALAVNNTGATLGGRHKSTAAVLGAATYDSITIDRPGSPYVLSATTPGVRDALSDSFAITIAFKSVSAGDRFTCGVSNASAAFCWGQNDVRQLGSASGGTQTTPVPVAGGLKFSIVSAGAGHSCGITTGRAAYCWGSDSAGALGDGNSTGSDSVPVPVSGGLTFIGISAGDAAFSCGLAQSTAAYCWGDNSAGQLGNGTKSAGATPVVVAGGLSFATIAAGGGPSACGVTNANAAYCWGDNRFGEIGNGTTTDSSAPVAITGLAFATVSAGNGYACGLTTGGQAYCWGLNTQGQLGDSVANGPQQCVVGGTSYPCSTAPVPVAGGLVFTFLSSGGSHTCGLTRAGAAYCWGSNLHGQLGNGSTADSSLVPVPVSGGLTFIGIGSGSVHTCGLTSGLAIYCWGDDSVGELGDGRQGAGVMSNVPVAVTP